MGSRLLQWVPVIVIGIVLLAIAGFTVGVAVVEAHHNRVIAAQSHALEVLDRIDEARVVLHEERVEVLASRSVPLDRRQLETLGQLFLESVGSPRLLRTSANVRLQQQVLAEHARYLKAALALPARPTAAQLLAVEDLATGLATRLEALRASHQADLRTIAAAERSQRVLSGTILIVADATVVALIVIGFSLRQRLERQRVQVQILRATDQLRNELVSFAAHELRNPATTISSGVWLFQHTEPDPETRQRALASMAESAAVLGRLVMNLLDMGRAEEGKLQLRCMTTTLPVLLNGLIEEVSAYRPDLPGRLRLTVPEVPVTVDVEYIRQALSNVLDNAIKHSPPDSPISIWGEGEGNMAVLHLHNEGEGIPPEHLPHIFEKYETYDRERFGGRGVGLGLYMTRLLIEAHGGRIWAESEPGQGATISLTLPR